MLMNFALVVPVFDLVWVAHADKLELRPYPSRGRHSGRGKMGAVDSFSICIVFINVRRYVLVMIVDKLICLVHS